MYLRDLIKIDFATSSIEDFPDWHNWTISKIKVESNIKLIANLAKKNSNSKADAYVRSIDGKNDTLEKIKRSNKVIGKTLNELVNTKLEEI